MEYLNDNNGFLQEWIELMAVVTWGWCIGVMGLVACSPIPLKRAKSSFGFLCISEAVVFY